MTDRINTFVYGSLMFDAVWNSLISNDYMKLGARLDGYARRCVRGEVYPGLIEAHNGVVNGVLVMGVTIRDIHALDRFEGNFYRRKPVTVSAPEHGLFEAETYVIRTEARSVLTDKEWNVEEFRENGLRIFMSEYKGFR